MWNNVDLQKLHQAVDTYQIFLSKLQLKRENNPFYMGQTLPLFDYFRPVQNAMTISTYKIDYKSKKGGRFACGLNLGSQDVMMLDTDELQQTLSCIKFLCDTSMQQLTIWSFFYYLKSTTTLHLFFVVSATMAENVN